MVQAEIIAALVWLHILTAISWMGTAMFLAMVLTPSMRGLSANSRGELMIGLLPRLIRIVSVSATLTLVWGVLLALAIGLESGSFSPSTAWGLRITVGAVIALVAYAFAMGVGLRSARRILKILRAQPGSQNLLSELPMLQKRMRLTAFTVVSLLTLVLVFMVVAAEGLY